MPTPPQAQPAPQILARKHATGIFNCWWSVSVNGQILYDRKGYRRRFKTEGAALAAGAKWHANPPASLLNDSDDGDEE